jgi:hypothetical protein
MAAGGTPFQRISRGVVVVVSAERLVRTRYQQTLLRAFQTPTVREARAL